MLQVPTLSDSLCGACHTAAAPLSSQHSEVAKKTVGGEKYLFSFTSGIYYVCKYFLSSDLTETFVNLNWSSTVSLVDGFKFSLSKKILFAIKILTVILLCI